MPKRGPFLVWEEADSLAPAAHPENQRMRVPANLWNRDSSSLVHQWSHPLNQSLCAKSSLSIENTQKAVFCESFKRTSNSGQFYTLPSPTFFGEQRTDVYVRSVSGTGMVWVLVCRRRTQYRHR